MPMNDRTVTVPTNIPVSTSSISGTRHRRHVGDADERPLDPAPIGTRSDDRRPSGLHSKRRSTGSLYRSLIHIPSLSSRCRYLRNITKTGGVVIVNIERAAQGTSRPGPRAPLPSPGSGSSPSSGTYPSPMPSLIRCRGAAAPVSGQFRGLPPLRTFYLRCVRVLVVFTWPNDPVRPYAFGAGPLAREYERSAAELRHRGPWHR